MKKAELTIIKQHDIEDNGNACGNELKKQEYVEAGSIKEARKSVGLTQQALSDWLEIPKRTIEDWEAGRRKCPDWCRKLIVEKIFTHK